MERRVLLILDSRVRGNDGGFAGMTVAVRRNGGGFAGMTVGSLE